MIIWLILLFLMCFIYAVEYLGKNSMTSVNGMTICIVVFLSVLSGLRGEMGVDFESYRYIFGQIPPLTEYLLDGIYFNPIEYFEPLYAILISIFKVFSDSYNLFLFFQSLVLLILVVVSLRRLNVPINIGLILYCFFSYLDHFGQQRMAVVYVLCLLATTYIVKKELFKFLFIIVIASLIQKTAIVFLPAYWFRYLLLSKDNNWSFRFDRFQIPYLRDKFFSGWFPNRDYKSKFWTRINMAKISILFIGCLYLVTSMNLAQRVLEVVPLLTGGNPLVDVYTSNFVSYYERMERSTNIVNASLGILKYITILIFLYIYRNRWLDIKTAPIFINYAAGIIMFILVYSIPKLGARLVQMYYLPAFMILFGIMGSQRRKPYNILPFIFFVCLFEYVSTILNETGPYMLSGF